MLNRIVKLTFQPDRVADFMVVFEQSKDKIRAFDGCLGMALMRDTAQPNVLFTYSHWVDAEALERYRQSELFQSTWAKTKVHFADKAEAWSVEMVDECER